MPRPNQNHYSLTPMSAKPMTRIYCTEKLKKFIGTVEESLPDDVATIRPSDWYAHLFYVEKKKILVFVNIQSYYTVFVVDVVKRDMKNIDEIFRNRLRQQLLNDLIVSDNEIIDFNDFEICFFKTCNIKRVIGKINDFVYIFKVHCFLKYGHLSNMNIVYENGIINETPSGSYAEKYKTCTAPKENIKKLLKM